MRATDPEIVQAIQNHPSDDLAQVSRDLTKRLKRHVPITAVAKVKGTMKRTHDVNQARESAAGTLATKVSRIEDASQTLEALFFDEALPLKDRIEASKELRQWTKLGMDAAGIHDAETETLFVIEGDWVMDER